MIKKGLQIVCDWNSTVISKFGMVDFDEKEMNVLDELLPDIKAFSCSFHLEQPWNGWTNKPEHAVSHSADDVKSRLCRIVHASSREEPDKSIKDLLSWEHFTGKMKVWFTKK